MIRFEVWNADRLVAVGVEFDEAEGARPAVVQPLGEPTPFVVPGSGLSGVQMAYPSFAVRLLDDEGPAQPKRKRARKSKAE